MTETLFTESRDRSTGSMRFAVAWCIWMAIQLATLAAFAGQVRLSAGYPMPVENSAGAAMAVVQISTAVLLAPVLTATLSDTAITLAGGAPMLVAATVLAGGAAASAVAPVAFLACWLVALINIGRYSLVHAAIVLLTLTGPAFWHAASDAGGAALTPWPAIIFPALAAAANSLGARPYWPAFISPATLAVVTALKPARFRKSTPSVTDQAW